MADHDELDDNPSTANLRSHLNGYLEAARAGRQFRIFRHRTPIGILGPVAEMPTEYEDDLVEIPFTKARDELRKTLTSSMLKAEAIVIVKLVKGPNTLPKRGGRRTAIARDKRRMAAIWPVPQIAVVAELGDELRRLTASQERLGSRLTDFIKSIAPLLQRFDRLGYLEREIETKREIANNLVGTIKRVRAS